MVHIGFECYALYKKASASVSNIKKRLNKADVFEMFTPIWAMQSKNNWIFEMSISTSSIVVNLE